MANDDTHDHADSSAWGLVEVCDTLIHSRQHLNPRHLLAPGPDDATLHALFAAAAAAPDHGEIQPWRWLVLGAQARGRLAEVFVSSLLEREPAARPDQCAEARDKAFRGAVLLVLVARLGASAPMPEGREHHGEIPSWERLLSAGCALQNLLLAATARGFGSGLSGGRALQSPALRQLLALAPDEQALCFVSLGSPRRHREPRQRPGAATVAQWLD